jgi:hypothetical protein
MRPVPISFLSILVDYSSTLHFQNKQEWKAVLFGVHLNCKRVLHTTTWTVTPVGCFTDNHSARNCGLRLLLLEKNNKGNEVILAVIRGHVCEPTMDSVPLLQQCASTITLVPLLQQCIPTMVHFHCNIVFQQWLQFPLLHNCVLTIILVPIVTSEFQQ